MTRQPFRSNRAPRAFAVAFALVAAAAPPGAGADVLEVEAETVAFGVSAGAGYSAVEAADGTTHLAFPQIGLRTLLWSRFEFAVDARADLRTDAVDADPVNAWLVTFWATGHIDLLPLSPFVGVGGGASILPDGSAAHATVGACAGLALWFESTWRLTLQVAQRWNFDEQSSLATDVALTAEWFF